MTVDLRTRLKEKLARLDPDVRAVIEELVAELERQRAALERLLHFQGLMDRVLENQRRIVGILEQLNRLSQRFEAMLQDVREQQQETRSQLQSVQQTLQELVHAQARLEARMTALEQRQDRTEQRLDDLTATVQKMQEEMAEMRAEFEDRFQMLHRRLEGISHSLGYFLENRALVVLPILLKRVYGIEVEGDLERRYVNVAGKMRQINIIGYGVRDGQRLLIVGETKVRPSKKEIARFLKTCEGLAEQEGLPLFPLIVAHDFPPEVQRFLEQEGVLAVPSYRIDKLWFERGGI